MKNKVSIIGTGAMATAVGKVIYDSGFKNIQFYGIDEKEISDLKNGKNTKYFSEEINLPSFEVSTDLNEVLHETNYIILVVPSKVMNIVMKNILNDLKSDVVIINASKGFYPETNFSLHEGILNATKNNKYVKNIVSLIGPSHAEQIVIEMPTTVALVSEDEEVIKNIQKLFNNNYFRTYLQTDVKGAEVGAAYKNALAIASGIVSGLGYGINTTAALLTRGISEMSIFNDFIGGEQKTLMGLTGLGDLIVTAMSPLSRNFSFGKELAKFGVDNAFNTDKTVEGIESVKYIAKISRTSNIDLPIINFLYDVIFEKRDIKKLLKELWNRDLKSE
ncbi:MAG: NAD(P)H-dependent glycerol-3-phosphate dehydrogenase [Mycoplasma sp.]|nr:NAD(P)H-dependent glycerol-3-phosphate dehydrogenase [Mycoplasma sp.]